MLRNFLVVGAGNYGAMAISLAINAVLTRRLGVEKALPKAANPLREPVMDCCEIRRDESLQR